MASNLMARAAKEIQSKSRTLSRIRADRKAETDQALGVGANLGGAVAAAWVDSKWGDGLEPAETMGLPRNAVIGLVGIAYGILGPKRAPGKAMVGMAGAGMTGAALYRYSLDKFEEREAENE